MGPKKMRAVSNSGPLIHLAQIKKFRALKIFNEIFIPEAVRHEILIKNAPGKEEIQKTSFIKLKELSPCSKDLAILLGKRYSIDMGEAQAITLCKQEKIPLFLTDDLDARTVAKSIVIETHGTVGILLRSFQEKLITKKEAIKAVEALRSDSTLFITNDLVKRIISEIQKS
ncbi:MAG: hypothetical protein HZB66_00270 [Candidatus Aenigmarchaeota archaeon]|nr:hypothetical protein [Candidatus Aenigmarchaeota archaeon]